MANWRDVINAYAVPEPCRPFTTRGMTAVQLTARVSTELGLDFGTRYVPDFEGRTFRLSQGLVKKLAKYANHAAYAGWVESTLLRPLEVWVRPDPHSNDMQPRRHYFGAYVGPGGVTSHLVVAAFGSVVINGFRLDNVSTADSKRFGELLHLGYSPVEPPLPMAKGAPFPMAPLPV